MQRIFILAFKDLKLITRDKLGMFFMLVFPVMMALFFGSMMSGIGKSDSATLKVVIADVDKSEMSARFIESMMEIDAVEVIELERDAAIDSVRRGKHVGVIVLPKGFGETAGIFWEEAPAIELGLDPSRKAEAGMLQGMVMQSMGQLVGTRLQNPSMLKPLIEKSKQQLLSDDSMPAAVKAALGTLMDSTTTMLESLRTVRETSDQEASGDSGDNLGFQMARVQQIDVSRQAEPGSKAAMMQNLRSGWDISFPQSMVWGILACVAGFATLIVREQTIGTHTRLLVAPVSRVQLLAGKGLACFLCLILVLTTMTLIAVALGMRPRRWDLLAMAIASICVCFVGLMLPLSLMGKTEQAVSGAVWGVCTVMAMFGGGMIPLMFMPDFVQTLSNFDPVKWAVYAMEGAIWRGLTFREMLLPCGILAGTGVVAAAIGAKIISRRQ